MKFFLCALSVLVSCLTPLHSENFVDQVEKVSYIFCLDGGGSKTALQILDSSGTPQPLYKGIDEELLVQGDCSNVVVVKPEGVLAVFTELFHDLRVGEKRERVVDVIPNSLFIGGFAGVGREEHKKQMQEVIEEIGFQPQYIHLYTDAGLALELVGEQGAILIGGTGSICFIKDHDQVRRIGGLGYRIGDNGSGYDMGLRAIKAAIQEEYQYGKHTSLTPVVKEALGVSSALDLIGPINGNELSPGKIASLAPLVFDHAWKEDEVAYQIVSECANQLGELLAQGVQTTEIKHCMTYLVGGLFQNEHANLFIQLLCKAPEMQKLSKGSRPLLVNVSEKMVPTLVVQEKLRLAKGEQYHKLSSLPIVEESACSDLYQKYNKEFLTTEHSNEQSKELSHTFFKDHLEGLKLIQALDYSAIEGSERFLDEHYDKMVQKILKKVKAGGRVIFVGSGTSGRISVDLAAKWKEYWKAQEGGASEYQDSVIGVIAGGARAFVKAKEKFEDSEYSGHKAMRDANLTSNDIVILISASGSANFNIGAGKAADEARADCYYFFNSNKVSEKTASLFKQYHVHPIVIDIGPQTISGSTRLQAASLAEFSWGAVLSDVLLQLSGKPYPDGESVGHKMLTSLKYGWNQVADRLPRVRDIVDMQIEVFSDENSNFWKAYDETYQGYVTFLSSEDCLREIMVDTTETPPTFSSNPPRSIREKGKKKAEYRAYFVGDSNNLESWKRLIGRDVYPDELSDVSEILVSMTEHGFGDYVGRTIAQKNLITGCFTSSLDEERVYRLVLELSKAKAKGLRTAAIMIEEEGFKLDEELFSYLEQNDVNLIIPDIAKDPMGIVKTLTLKQVLNLISNGAMIGMNKVHGNIMIDLAPSNNKLIDRSIRIIQEIYSEYHNHESPFDYELLYHYVTRALKYKKIAESQLGKHIPSPAKLVLTMLEKDLSVEQAVAMLKINNENIGLILSNI